MSGFTILVVPGPHFQFGTIEFDYMLFVPIRRLIASEIFSKIFYVFLVIRGR